MKMKSVFVALSLLLVGIHGFTQNITNRGKEFWVSYGHHQFMESPTDNSQDMVLYLSAEEPAVVTVTLYGSGPGNPSFQWKRTYNIPANTVISTGTTTPQTAYPAITGAPGGDSWTMPKSGAYDSRLWTSPPPVSTGGAGLFNKKAFHIQSNVPIVAYSHIYGSASSGATMLLPIDAWGYTYTSVNSEQSYSSNCYSWMYVIAKEDNTVIEISVPVKTRAMDKTGLTPGVPKIITLNKGQVYQVIGANTASDANGNGGNASTGFNLTGATIRSIANNVGQCFPIAAFSGSSRTANPAACGSGGGDNDMQQMFPERSWGKRYLTAPLAGSGNASSQQTNGFKIAVTDPSTVVKKNGVTLTGLINGLYYYYQSSTPDYIEADKPIMIAQFMTGGNSCLAGSWGDPEMIYLSPIEQAIKRTGFYTNDQENIEVSYLNVIIPTGGMPTLKIDGSSVFNHTYPHPTKPGYTVAIKRWAPSTPGQHIVQSDSGFNAIVYGLGSVESYGYNAGTNLDNLNAIGSVRNDLDTNAAVTEHPFTCTNTPVHLSALIAYQPLTMNWKLSAAPGITPNTDVFVGTPVASDTIVIGSGTYYKYTLPGTYYFSQQGEIFIPITLTSPTVDNCSSSETVYIKILVREKPVSDFTITQTGCHSDPVQFQGTSGTGGNYTIAKWVWDLGGTAANGQNTAKVFTPGTYPIKLTVITTVGCLSDSIKSVTIVPSETPAFSMNKNAICLGDSVLITPQTTTTTQWYWDFGSGKIDTLYNSNPFYLKFDSAGKYKITHTVKSAGTCTSSPKIDTVRVFSIPKVNFTIPAGCFASNGLVNLSDSSYITDDSVQVINKWKWTFNDPNSSASNPDTSILRNPSHTFKDGSYGIKLSVATSKGCSKDTTITKVIKLKPSLSFAPLGSYCISDQEIMVNKATVTNGVPGTGTYKGNGITDATAGKFKGSVAGAGTHTIWYVFDNGGCIDSISQTITVHPLPTITTFTYSPQTCLPENGAVQFNAAATAGSGTIASYKWWFGDSAIAGTATSNLQNPSRNMKDSTYNISLIVISDKGCETKEGKTITFKVTPALTTPTYVPVCEDAAAITLARPVVTNNVQGSGVFAGGAYIDANGVFTPSIAGGGTHPITYKYTSNSGCEKTINLSMTVYARPTASFTATPDVCLGAGTVITPSTAGAMNIQKWNWEFGNSDVSTKTNATQFTYKYAQADTFTIQLTTVSPNGCVSTIATQTVYVNPVPQADFMLTGKICFPGGAANFSNISQIAGNTNLNWNWTFGDGGTSTTQSPQHFYTNYNTGSYNVRLIATSDKGCKDTAIHQIDLTKNPVADFSIQPAQVCQGKPVNISDNSTSTDAPIKRWRWTYGDGTHDDATIPGNRVKVYNGAGEYTVKLTVTNDDGCSHSDTMIVTVHPQPKIDAGKSFVVPQGTVIKFEPRLSGATPDEVTFEWTPKIPQLINPDSLKASLIVLDDGTFTLTATTKSFGCSSSDKTFVKMLKQISIPNAFTPNGDGTNDYWLIPGLEDYPGHEIQVFNRQGVVVFSSTNYKQPWNGTYDGKPLPVGTYYYIIDPKNGYQQITGSITILR